MTLQAARACAQSASLMALLLAAAIPSRAQVAPLNDPANLAGQRIAAPSLADTLPIDHGALALQQLLRKLRTRASFMLIVAHPDDEDNGALTYLSRGKGARVATLTLNRGEGGQNLMSADFEDALGLIRTQELLAADRYMDTDQFFGTEVDFGFSKTKEESFAKWTHQRVLYDAVRAIRLYRPLVIASVFIGEPSDGHGQHQVSGEIAQEAFKAASDPSVFPDQGLPPWQPLKVYARVPFARIDAQGMFDYATGQYVPARFENYVTGKVTNTVPPANVVVPEGDTDPLLGGASYAQFGREGRSLQRSQIGGGGGGPFSRGGGGRFDVSYHRYGSMLHQPDGDISGLESGFFDGIDTSLPGIADLAPEVSDKFRPFLERIDQRIADAQQKFNPAKPELIAPQLRDALRGMDSFIHELESPSIDDLPPTESYNLLHELRIKRVQLNDALVLAHGLTLTAALDGGRPGQSVFTTQTSLRVSVALAAPSDPSLRLDQIVLDAPDHLNAKASLPSSPAIPGTVQIQLAIPHGLPATRPYFSRPDIEQPYYNISNPALRNAPETPDPLTVSAALSDDGVPLTVIATVAATRQSGPNLPAVIVPPVSVSLDRSVAILRPGEKSVGATATVKAEEAIQKLGGIEVYLDRNSAGKGELLGTFLPEEYQKVIGQPEHIGISADASRIDGHTSTLTAVVSQQGHSYTEGFRPVGYPGLTPTNYYRPATLRIVPVDVHIASGLNIAYLPGTGDDVPSALDQLGIHMVHLLTPHPTPESLKPYDAIVLGVRAWEAHRDMSAIDPALLGYAQAGGVVIVQYVARDLPTSAAPYPLSLGSNEKVVDETAPVRILAPTDPLLNWPNKIVPADFNGWIEERGHGFMATWDPHYTPLLETHDPGQQPQDGGLLVARTGKGFYVYLGLALYRQLPEGVPGAYRLFANLISVGKNPQFVRSSR